jgi:SAM-dependent methyltransferase
VSGDDVARRVAALYPTRFLRWYVRWKVAADPVYAAVFERLGDVRDPIVDLGCGAGVLAAYLRIRGNGTPVSGIDHDARKIDIARRCGLPDATFTAGDVSNIALRGAVVMLDVLHYLSDEAQWALLRRAAGEANIVIVRDAIRDGSLRYRLTYAEETLARAVGWLKAPRLNFPRLETVGTPFAAFDAEVTPLWGRTPFNNYLFVFRRASSGMTNE